MKTIRLDSRNSQITLSMLSGVVDFSLDDTIFVFDFDGVLASPVEDLIYRLPIRKDEKGFLKNAAAYFQISYDLFETSYLRHIVLQNILLQRRRPIDTGPLSTMAKALCLDGVPVFVLSARSAPPAVSRALSFLNLHAIQPQETFFVGRVGKGRQLSLLEAHSNGKRIVYFDDSIRHSRNAYGQKADSIISVHLGWNRKDLYSEAIALYEDSMDWLEGVMQDAKRTFARG